MELILTVAQIAKIFLDTLRHNYVENVVVDVVEEMYRMVKSKEGRGTTDV